MVRHKKGCWFNVAYLGRFLLHLSRGQGCVFSQPGQCTMGYLTNNFGFLMVCWSLYLSFSHIRTFVVTWRSAIYPPQLPDIKSKSQRKHWFFPLLCSLTKCQTNRSRSCYVRANHRGNPCFVTYFQRIQFLVEWILQYLALLWILLSIVVRINWSVMLCSLVDLTWDAPIYMGNLKLWKRVVSIFHIRGLPGQIECPFRTRPGDLVVPDPFGW